MSTNAHGGEGETDPHLLFLYDLPHLEECCEDRGFFIIQSFYIIQRVIIQNVRWRRIV